VTFGGSAVIAFCYLFAHVFVKLHDKFEYSSPFVITFLMDFGLLLMLLPFIWACVMLMYIYQDKCRGSLFMVIAGFGLCYPLVLALIFIVFGAADFIFFK